MRAVVRRALLPALAVLCLTATPALAAGPITSLHTVKRTQLRPGVFLTHLRATVRGFPTQDLYRVDWAIGDAHVRLRSELRGTFDPSNRSIRDRAISTWAATTPPAGLVAAMTGDFSTPLPWNDRWSTVSGLLVHANRVYSFGWGGPGVGYTNNGGLVFGHPTAVPATLLLPGGHTATIGAFGGFPSSLRGDQVAAFTGSGTAVKVPAGAVGVALDSAALQAILRGTRVAANVAGGLGVRERVAGFRFADPAVAPHVTPMPIAQPAACPTRVCAAGTRMRVPTDGAVLLARDVGPAAGGLTALAGAATPSLRVVGSPARWAGVTDVTGGKPTLVDHGVAVSSRPAFVDTWQWSCGGGCWRTALARSGSRGWLIVGGSAWADGVTMPVWAHMLKQLGASQALGFDANNSAELYMPGRHAITGYGYERRLPTLTALTFTP